MNLDEIKELITLMRKHKIKEVDLDQKGNKIRIVASDPPASNKTEKTREVVTVPSMPAAPLVMPNANDYAMMQQAQAASAQAPAPAPKEEAPAAKEEAPEELSGVEIKSPMVGTFYRAPSPDAPSYVEVGSVINPDTVLCIVEAMKLMNEIKAEMRGKVLKVLVENGQPVEFNQPLFLVEPF